MAPVSELRGALPLAYFGFHWSITASFLVSAAFNIMAGGAVFFLLAPVSRFLRAHWPVLNNFYERRRVISERRHGARLQRAGALGLFLIVALPLPATGAWTGALLAHLFQLPPRLALSAITGGVIGAGLIVSAAVLLADQLPALLKVLLLGKIQP